MKFEERMRALEAYHSIKVPEGSYIILRVDGRSFSALTEKYFVKPVDSRFQDMMLATTEGLVVKLDAIYGFVESDEISILLSRDTNFFDREHEKLVSVSAGLASAFFMREFKAGIDHDAEDVPHFDSRVIVCPDEDTVFDYFLWRQADAQRCALNGLLYWTLRQDDFSASKATRLMNGMNRDAKLVFLKETYDIDFESTQVEYRNGSGITWEFYEKEGVNPITDEVSLTLRRRTKINRGLPSKNEYVSMLSAILEEDRNE